VSFETEFGDEVGEELIEDALGGVKRLGHVAVGEEEVLDYTLGLEW